MKLDTCLLCDAATVREGLLNILGGGITSIVRDEFPSPLGMSLALRVLAEPAEAANPHTIEIALSDEGGNDVVQVKIGLELAESDVHVPESSHLEAVLAWDFPGRPVIPHPGRYSFEILIDGISQRSIPLMAAITNEDG
jgi:hypothetical protein